MNFNQKQVFTNVDVSNFQEYDNHKTVMRFEDPQSNLVGFLSVHNDNLGPAVGGTRMFPYKTEKEAISDVLRLSRSMTYKNAISGLYFGGGKSVIIGDAKSKNKKLLKSYAEIIKSLEGRFYTGEDVGISEEDVQFMLEYCPYFIGKTGFAGDPSPFSSLSVFYTMQTALEESSGNSCLKNRIIAIKGLGKIGMSLLNFVKNAGAKIIVADINPVITNDIKNQFPDIVVVGHEEIHKQNVDVFSPCALGGDLNEKILKELRCKIVCGGANNQLSAKEMGNELMKAGILYVPDYLANAGGLINVVDELEHDGYNRARVLKRIEKLKSTLKRIILTSIENKSPTNVVADRLAENFFTNKVSNLIHV